MSEPTVASLTKEKLTEEIARAIEVPRYEAQVILETICNGIVRALRTGDKVEIRGFGSFRTRERQSRIGRNPKTGTRVDVPTKRIAYFKPGKDLRDVINQGESSSIAADDRTDQDS